MSDRFESFESLPNPIDSVEEVLASNNWVFSRMTNDELMVQVCGKACEYKLFFIWQEDLNAMQFCCQFEEAVSEGNRVTAANILMNVNENLWMGHFDLPRHTNIPCFRHTCLLRGIAPETAAEQIEDLVTIAMAQCERLYPLFHMLTLAEPANENNLHLAMMESAGRS